MILHPDITSKKITESFQVGEERFLTKYQNLFDYSNSVFKGWGKPLTITCNKHKCDITWTTASGILNFNGEPSHICPQCSDEHLIAILGPGYTKLKKVWHYMISRCHDDRDPNYPAYGGKGIVVCEEWRNSFEAFEQWALDNNYTEYPKVQLDKDLMAWAFNRVPEYSPRGALFITPEKNMELKRRLK